MRFSCNTKHKLIWKFSIVIEYTLSGHVSVPYVWCINNNIIPYNYSWRYMLQLRRFVKFDMCYLFILFEIKLFFLWSRWRKNQRKFHRCTYWIVVNNKSIIFILYRKKNFFLVIYRMVRKTVAINLNWNALIKSLITSIEYINLLILNIFICWLSS